MIKMSSKKGFTLVEMIVVITILAILAVISIQGIGGIIAKSKAQGDVTVASQIGTAVADTLASNKILSTDFGTNNYYIERLGTAGESITNNTVGAGKVFVISPVVQGVAGASWDICVTKDGDITVMVNTGALPTVDTGFTGSSTSCVLYPKNQANFSGAMQPYNKLY